MEKLATDKNSAPVRTIRAAIYVRVSTDKQEEEGASLETQQEACISRAVSERYQLAQEYHIYSEAYTGTVLDRPVLNRLREDAANNEFDVLIFYAYDRLARKQILQAVLIDFFNSKNIQLISVTENFDDSSIGQFMRNAAAFAAEYEIEKIKERTSRGRTAKLRKGQLLGSGRPTYGYTWNEDHTGYLVNLREADIVTRIFEWYTIQNWSLYAILNHLRDNYPTTNRKTKKGTEQWAKSSVWRILSNPYYTGKGYTNKWRNEIKGKERNLTQKPIEDQIPIANGVIPPIIDDETFLLAKERLAINKQLADRNNYNPEMALLRSGFAVCGNCGHKLRAHRKGPQKDGTKERYVYSCNDYTSIGRCKKISINCNEVDTEAWKYVQELMQDHTQVENRLAELEKKLSKSGNTDVTPIDSQLAETERLQKNCAKAMIKSADDNYLLPMLEQEAHELAKTRRELEKLRMELMRSLGDIELIRSKIDAFRNKWINHKTKLQGEPTYEDKRIAVQILGLRVVIYSHGHLPRYTFQIMPPDIEFLISLHQVARQPRP